MPRRSRHALLLLLALAPVVRAQSSNASLNGRIIDSVKAVIVKAHVALINLGTNVRSETTTNVKGEYYLPNLALGLYGFFFGARLQSWFHEHLRKITNYHFSSSQQVRPTNTQPRIFPRLFEVKQ